MSDRPTLTTIDESERTVVDYDEEEEFPEETHLFPSKRGALSTLDDSVSSFNPSLSPIRPQSNETKITLPSNQAVKPLMSRSSPVQRKPAFALHNEKTAMSLRHIAHESLQGLDWERRKLYGRVDELRQLSEACKLAHESSVQTVSITGPEGAGKTALMEQFCNSLVQATAPKNVLLCRGKFDEIPPTSTDPFPAIMTAMRQLVDTLLQRIEVEEKQEQQNLVADLTSDDDNDEGKNPDRHVRQDWRQRLIETLNTELDVLYPFIPNLRQVINGANVADWIANERSVLAKSLVASRSSSERMPRRGMMNDNTSTSELSRPSTKECFKDSSNTFSASSKSSLASDSSRWQAIALKRGFSGEIRSQSALQPQTTSFETFEQFFRNTWTIDRLRLALRALVRIISTHFTVVFAIDALQWADQQSLGLLETVLSDELPGRRLLFLTTMRVSVDKETVNVKSLRVVTDRNSTIFVDNLSKKAIGQWIGALLHQGDDAVQSLVEIVHAKTAGNPFFAEQFLRDLDERNLLYFSTQSLKWEWDSVRIQSDTSLCKNVLEIVLQKIRWLPRQLQKIIIIASCFGSSLVDVELIVHALNPPPGCKDDIDDNELLFGPNHDAIEGEDLLDVTVVDICQRLGTAVKLGLLEHLSDNVFKFSHDRVREGVALMYPSSESMNEMHLRIGRRLHSMLDDMPPTHIQTEKGGTQFLQMVRHLNHGASRLATDSEKAKLADLNFQAAELAMGRASFVPATTFAEQGMELLGEDRWVLYPQSMERLGATLTRIHYCCGRIYKSLMVANDVISNSTKFEAKIPVYHNKILCLIQSGKGTEALKLTLTVLGQLDIRFPERSLGYHVRKEEAQTRKMLKKLSKDDLCRLAPVESPNSLIESQISFMERLLEVSVHSPRPRPEYTALVSMRLMQLTLKRGRFTRTSCFFVFWAWYLASLGQFEEAIYYGDIGLAYADQMEGGIYDSRAKLLYHNFIHHWKHPFYESIDPVTRAIKSYWTAGAVELVHMETFPYLRFYFCTGLRLEPLISDMRRYTQLMKDYRRVHSLESSLPFFQMISNLMGNSVNPRILTGEFMSEENKREEWHRVWNIKATNMMNFHRMMLAYYFGDIDIARGFVDHLSEDFGEGPDAWVPYRFFFEGLIRFAAYRKTRQLRQWRRGMQILRMIGKWNGKGAVNCRHMSYLLLAESMASKRSCKSEDVRKAFDKAISSAARAGFVNTHALANERAGLYFLRKGDPSWAATFMGRARDLYNSWGATAKVEHITEVHQSLLSPSNQFQKNVVGGHFRARPRLDLITTAHYESLRLNRLSPES